MREMTWDEVQDEYARRWHEMRIKESGHLSQEDKDMLQTDKISSEAIRKVIGWLEQHHEGTNYDISRGLKMQHDYIQRTLKYLCFKGVVVSDKIQDISIFRIKGTEL